MMGWVLYTLGVIFLGLSFGCEHGAVAGYAAMGIGSLIGSMIYAIINA
jgi:hypothetical protein